MGSLKKTSVKKKTKKVTKKKVMSKPKPKTRKEKPFKADSDKAGKAREVFGITVPPPTLPTPDPMVKGEVEEYYGSEDDFEADESNEQ